ncbi:hypothetical protein VNO77_16336 [Canavalia gladiata]|uniref:NTF2 domain-containing protein n=1 Tax=Canavalia gladiata TaxID=3824 RepID=A0AAN9QT03_CANGL
MVTSVCVCGSSMTRVDGDTTKTAHGMQQIHQLVKSLNFVRVEVKTINSLYGMNRSVLVMLSGFVKIRNVNGMRKFVQTVFLAPQEKSYYVLTDIFQFIDDGVTYPNPEPVPCGNIHAQPHASTSLEESPVSDYDWEEEISKYIDSICIEDDPADEYSLPEQQQQQQQDLKTEIMVEETPLKEASPSMPNVACPVHEIAVDREEEPLEEAPKKTYASAEASPSIPDVARPIHETAVAHEEEPLEEAPKKTYASALQCTKRQATPSVSLRRSNQVSSILSEGFFSLAFEVNPFSAHFVTNCEWQGNIRWFLVRHEPYLLIQRNLRNKILVFYGEIEQELKIFVKNLPASITKAEVEQEFKIFGKIRPDGTFIKLREEIGACYAFVEFEDILGVQNSLQASPIKLAGRQVYIEQWRRTTNWWWRCSSGKKKGDNQKQLSDGCSKGTFWSREHRQGKYFRYR